MQTSLHCKNVSREIGIAELESQRVVWAGRDIKIHLLQSSAMGSYSSPWARLQICSIAAT